MRYLIALFVLLTGCVTQEQMAAQRAYELHQQEAAKAAYKQRVYGQCRAYGFSEGTDQFRQCLMQVDQSNQAQNAQMRQMIIQQIIQRQGEAETRAMPYCSSLPAVIAGFQRAQGSCR